MAQNTKEQRKGRVIEVLNKARGMVLFRIPLNLKTKN